MHQPTRITGRSLGGPGTSGVSRRRLLGVGAAGSALALAGFAPWSDPASLAAQTEPKRGGSFTICVSWPGAETVPGRETVDFDPMPGPDTSAGVLAITHIYEQLTRIGADGQTIEGGLAESWDVAQDGLSYTFHLRESRFHNGSPVIAADVAYSLTRLTEQIPLLPPHTWETPDDRTAVAKLEQPWYVFPVALSHPIASIVPQRLVEEQGLPFFDQPIGSGPFLLDSWDDAWEYGTRIVLKRNPTYRETGLPYLDELVIVDVNHEAARAPLLQAGELDAVDYLPVDAFAALATDPTFTVLDDGLALIQVCAINSTKPPFDDPNLRRAMNYALDKHALIDAVLGGHGKPATTYLPDMVGHDDVAPGFPFGLDKARALVAQSAGKDGFTAELLIDDNDTVAQATAPLIRDQLARIGGTVPIVAANPEESGARLSSNRYDLKFDRQFSQYLDPDLPTRVKVYGPFGNAAHYANPKVDALYEQAVATADPDQRAGIYKQIQTAVYEDAPYLLLFDQDARAAVRRSVHGFRLFPVDVYRLWEVWRDDV